jgi:hypothetical protein
MFKINISAWHICMWSWFQFPVKPIPHVIERVALSWQLRFPPGVPVSSYIHYKSPNIVFWANNVLFLTLSSQLNIFNSVALQGPGYPHLNWTAYFIQWLNSPLLMVVLQTFIVCNNCKELSQRLISKMQVLRNLRIHVIKGTEKKRRILNIIAARHQVP